MSDVIYVAALIAFFVICALYVHFCDSIIGQGDLPSSGRDGDPDAEEATAITALGTSQKEVTV